MVGALRSRPCTALGVYACDCGWARCYKSPTLVVRAPALWPPHLSATASARPRPQGNPQQCIPPHPPTRVCLCPPGVRALASTECAAACARAPAGWPGRRRWGKAGAPPAPDDEGPGAVGFSCAPARTLPAARAAAPHGDPSACGAQCRRRQEQPAARPDRKVHVAHMHVPQQRQNRARPAHTGLRQAQPDGGLRLSSTSLPLAHAHGLRRHGALRGRGAAARGGAR